MNEALLQKELKQLLKRSEDAHLRHAGEVAKLSPVVGATFYPSHLEGLLHQRSPSIGLGNDSIFQRFQLHAMRQVAAAKGAGSFAAEPAAGQVNPDDPLDSATLDPITGRRGTGIADHDDPESLEDAFQDPANDGHDEAIASYLNQHVQQMIDGKPSVTLKVNRPGLAKSMINKFKVGTRVAMKVHGGKVVKGIVLGVDRETDTCDVRWVGGLQGPSPMCDLEIIS